MVEICRTLPFWYITPITLPFLDEPKDSYVYAPSLSEEAGLPIFFLTAEGLSPIFTLPIRCPGTISHWGVTPKIADDDKRVNSSRSAGLSRMEFSLPSFWRFKFRSLHWTFAGCCGFGSKRD